MRALLIVCVLAFGAMLGVLTLGRDSDEASDRRAGASTEATILTRLEARARTHPDDVDTLVRLGKAYTDAAGATGDIGYYERADRVLARAIERDPKDPAAWTESGVLRLIRHDFRGALADGANAHELAPDAVKPLGVLVDANVETGRYDEAARVLQQMVDLKPNLDSYARVSYLRELNGDLDGAVEALDLAESAAGAVGENVAYIRSLRATLNFSRGRHEAARAEFEQVLRSIPDYGPAQYGLARMDAGAGRLDAARQRLLPLSEEFPELYILVLLGEIDLAANRPNDAQRWFEAVRERRKDFAAASANTDVESAVFEADHGDRAAAVTFARKAWRDAPSVTSADAMGWALTRNGRPREGLRWSRRALRLGSRDPLLRYHAGIAAQAAGRPNEAISLLRFALKANPAFSPVHAPHARAELAALESTSPSATTGRGDRGAAPSVRSPDGQRASRRDGE